MRRQVWIAGIAALAASLTLAAQTGQGTSGGSQRDREGAAGQTGSSRSGSSTSSGGQTGMAGSKETTAAGKVSSADRKFIMDAAQGGMLEVELGRMAASKASSDDVKQFAQRMVDDHTKANDQLKQVASQKGITIPSDLDARHKRDLDRFSKMSGAELDKAYMTHMVRDHEKDVREFRRASERSSDPDVKNFASSTLPTLEQHLHMAHDTGTKVGANVGSGASSADRSADRKKSTGGADTAGTSGEDQKTRKRSKKGDTGDTADKAGTTDTEKK